MSNSAAECRGVDNHGLGSIAVMKDSPLCSVSVNEYLDRLASPAPIPGGGSTAALAGALAAALGRMVCALTVDKPKFADSRPQLEAIASRLTRSEMMLKRLIDEDAGAYGELHTALKIDRSDPYRKDKVASAAELAAAVPLETVAVSRQVFVDLKRLETLGNPNLLSDVEASLQMARAAMLAAAANVRINLSLLPEQKAFDVAEALKALTTAE